MAAAGAAAPISGLRQNPEEEAAIRARFVTHNIPHRKDGSAQFTEFARSYVRFTQAVLHGGVDEAEAAFEDLSADLVKMDCQMLKMQLACDAIRSEADGYVRKKEALQADVEQAHRDIEVKKQELVEARLARTHNEEYEALRNLVHEEPPRPQTSAEIAAIQREIDAGKLEAARVARKLERRRQQFALLLTCLEELQAPDGVDDDDGDDGDGNGDGEGAEDADVDAPPRAATSNADATGGAMQVD